MELQTNRALPEASAGEFGEAVAVDVYRQGTKARDQNVQAEVELFPTYQKRIGDVALNHERPRIGRVMPSNGKHKQPRKARVGVPCEMQSDPSRVPPKCSVSTPWRH